ncbi:mandelate racemase/muconate lactonizing enzyme family protein [Ochrobactrum sp. C6C9]|uniref:mandelate racemase/muconate lactonizing enzyme family protein n=1 Tax=Ochrobactrum sp. C6C9 TaxID=2736662 RepID=UPI0035302401|nr:mandelate racemase/muconate lactonizing enzyme family protein [Ochrobactrum sp. C6C9]
MKIDLIQAFVIGNPWKNWVLVKVGTSDGHVGWGEATTGLTTKPVVGAVEEISRLFIGRDPRQMTANWQEAYKTLYLPTDGVIMAAMAGIETACWDIVGKELNVPLYRLLGGIANPKVRAYANGWYQEDREPERFAARARAVADAGFTAMKFDPLGHNYRVLPREERAKTIALVESVRNALPDSIDLILEFHDRLTPVEAISVSQDLLQFRPLWIEDPVWSSDVEGFAAVAKRSNVRIAGGERFGTLGQFTNLFQHKATDIVLPEYLRLGGLTRLRQVAAIAEAHNALVAPHNAQSPLGTAVNIHFDMATPNAFIQECFDAYHVKWAQDIFDGVPTLQDGYLQASDRPGHGVTIDEAELLKHPYGERNFMNLFGKGWERRNS